MGGPGDPGGGDPGPSVPYVRTDTVAPYVSPATATAVPGFVVTETTGDEEQLSVALPFSFDFFGTSYDSVFINANGYLTFSPRPLDPDPYENDCPIDATLPDSIIALFWDDHKAPAATNPTGELLYAVEGTAPDRRFIVEYRNFDAYYKQGNNYWVQGLRMTQSVTLHENGDITFRYGPRTPPIYDREDCGADRHRGCSATVGLEAPTGERTTVQCGTPLGQSSTYTPINEGRVIIFEHP